VRSYRAAAEKLVEAASAVEDLDISMTEVEEALDEAENAIFSNSLSAVCREYVSHTPTLEPVLYLSQLGYNTEADNSTISTPSSC